MSRDVISVTDIIKTKTILLLLNTFILYVFINSCYLENSTSFRFSAIHIDLKVAKMLYFLTFSFRLTCVQYNHTNISVLFPI